MKKNVWLLVLAVAWIAMLTNCNKEQAHQESMAETEAKAIADSLRDAEELKKWVGHFEMQNERRAALLVRQKYGQVLRDKSDFESAIKQHDTCIALAKDIKDTMQLIIAYNNQGTNFRRLGDLHGASNNHYAALELCDHSMSDTSFTARKNRVRTYNGLGNVLLSLQNDSVAEVLFHRALAGETELGSATGQAINYANIGAIKEGRGELDSALIYYNMSMEKNQETGNPIGICLCYQYLGRLHHIQGDTDKALENYRKAYEIGRRTSDVWHWLKPCEAIAEIFLEENRKDSAQKYINITLEEAGKIKSRSHLARAYSLYARLLEQAGKHEQAIQNVRIAQAYRDSIAVEQNKTHIQNLRVNYEVKKRIEDVERAQTEAGYQKKLRWIATWACIVIVILIILVMLSQVRIQRERQKTLKAVTQADMDRQEFYRGITHQLRPPLTVINGMIEQLRKFLPTDNDVAQKELQAMERKSEELLTLVREMIDFNKGTREEVRVSELAVTSANASSAEGIINQQTPPTEPYILVAEDDSDVALLITEMLKEEGYPYYWAKDGQEAYNAIHGYPPPIFGRYRHYDAKYGRSGTYKKNQERTGHQSSAIDSGFCTRGGQRQTGRSGSWSRGILGQAIRAGRTDVAHTKTSGATRSTETEIQQGNRGSRQIGQRTTGTKPERNGAGVHAKSGHVHPRKYNGLQTGCRHACRLHEHKSDYPEQKGKEHYWNKYHKLHQVVQTGTCQPSAHQH